MVVHDVQSNNLWRKINSKEIAYDSQQSFANEHDVIKQLVLCKIIVKVKFVFILNINRSTS